MTIIRNTENESNKTAIFPNNEPEIIGGYNGNGSVKPSSTKEADKSDEEVEAVQYEKKARNIPNTVKNTVGDAQLLIDYVIQTGVDIGEDDLKIIIESRDKANNNLWMLEEEVTFWQTLQKIHKKIEPVRLDTLKDTTNEKKEQIKKSVNAYTWGAIVCMIIFFACHGYSVIGTTLLGEINRLNSSITTLTIESNVLSIVKEKEKELQSQAQVDTEKTNIDTTILALNEIIAKAENKIQSSTEDEVNKNLSEIFTLLSYWCSFGFFKILGLSDTDIYLIAKLTNEMILFYFLPAVYGGLGASIYLLRSLTESINNRSYLDNYTDKTYYIARIILGIFGGLMISLIVGLSPQSSEIDIISTLRTIPPLILAFLMGYYVEIFFLFLEKLHNWFKR